MVTPTARSEGISELGRAIAEAEASTIVMWRAEPIAFTSLPERIAELSGRAERDALYGAYREALDRLNPLYERRLEAWRAAGDLADAAATDGVDPRTLAVDLERLVLHSETPYYASLRRYLALIDIEQGDATIADLWHVTRGAAWAHWFGEREVSRAVEAVAGGALDLPGLRWWRAAESMLAGAAPGADGPMGPAVRAAYTSLVGSPQWLEDELRVSPAEIPSLADFLAFVRLWRLRRDVGRLHYELRLFGDQGGPVEAAVLRAYYGGIVGHMIGVLIPEERYLADVPAPFASATDVETALLAAQLVEVLEGRHGLTWWRVAAAAELIAGFAAATSVPDALAHLGYDALDWRPVLRQIRTRLIGEMSGYGGPNITTRAGTRKV